NHKPYKASRSVGSEYCDPSDAYGPSGSLGTPGGHGGDCALVDGYVVDFAANHPFIDIKETGTWLGTLLMPNQRRVIPGGLGFSMPYFGDYVSDLWVNSNGLIGLGTSPNTSSLNRNLGGTFTGDGKGEGLIAPFWDSLAAMPENAGVYVDHRVINGSQVAIVQFDNYRYNSIYYVPKGS